MKAGPAKVVWYDACGGKTGWLNEQEAKRYEPYVCDSYGWLIRSDKDVVTLAISRHPTKSGGVMYADTLDIPRGMVKSIKRL
jgi:hypothetical protein